MSGVQGINLQKEEIKNKQHNCAKNYIASLKLSNFRNYQSYQADFPNCPVAFIGKNGTGKTNILEAISLMQPGRGIRSVRLEEIAYKSCGNFAIYMNLIKDMEKFGIGSSLDLNSSKSRKVKIDGKLYEIENAPELNKKIKHDISILVDRIVLNSKIGNRLADSVETALTLSNGLLFVEYENETLPKQFRKIVNLIHRSQQNLEKRSEILSLRKPFFAKFLHFISKSTLSLVVNGAGVQP